MCLIRKVNYQYDFLTWQKNGKLCNTSRVLLCRTHFSHMNSKCTTNLINKIHYYVRGENTILMYSYNIYYIITLKKQEMR